MEIFKGKYTDLEYLNNICEGDGQFIMDMIDTFLKDTPGIIARMENLASEQQWKQLGEIAHSFKTTLMFMGIQALYNTIRKVEHSGRLSQDVHALPELVKEVKIISQRSMEELQSYRDTLKP